MFEKRVSSRVQFVTVYGSFDDIDSRTLTLFTLRRTTELAAAPAGATYVKLERRTVSEMHLQKVHQS